MNAYRRAVKDVTDTRRADLDAGLQKWRQYLAENKSLHAAFTEYQNAAVLNAQKLPNNLAEARKKLAAEAKALGITKQTIEPPCRCEKCNDTGYVNGKYCSCVVKRVIEENGENLILPQIDFDGAQKTAPAAIAKVYAAARKYVDEFPDNVKKPFFMIVGSSGTGKTVLAAAIAAEFMKKGGSAVTVTAFDFVKRAKDYHTQFAVDDYRDLFSPMLECDILVIDDLGTETMLKNVTCEYLYTVINERWLRGMHTVVTTNLTPDALLKRYGESVFSRLCDKTKSNNFMVTAKKNERL